MTKLKLRKIFATATLAVAVVFTLTACADSKSGMFNPLLFIAGGSNTAVISAGTMTKGSVIVNGVRFTAAAGAAIRIDDNPNRLELELRNGMGVKVKGRIYDDRINGAYDMVEAEPEVRGKLLAKGAANFTVNGQSVFIDDLTEFEHRAGDDSFTSISFSDLLNNNEVEVHGGRDDQGRILASRVERRAVHAVDEVKGFISSVPTGSSFTLTNGVSSITVNYTGASITPSGATLSQNDFVEVHGSYDSPTTTLTATRIDREDLEDSEFEPAEGQETQVEGFVSGFTGHPGDFNVADRTVRTASGTRFESGSSADLANNVRVEAEGHLQAGILIADKIKFKRQSIRLKSTVTEVSGAQIKFFGSPGTGFLAVTTNSLTDNKVGAISQGDSVEVRGFEDKLGNVIASRIDSAGGGKDYLRGRVTAKAFNSGSGAGSLTILGLTGATTNSTTFFSLGEISLLTPAAFYGAVVPASGSSPGSLVKMKGTFSGTAGDIDEAEFEN